MKKITLLFLLLLIFTSSFTACTPLPEESDEPQSPGEVASPDGSESNLSISELLGHEGGHFELSITLDLEEEQVCTIEYPFIIRTEGERILLTGASDVALDCRFFGRVCGDTCSTMNVILDFYTRIDGEVLIDASDSPMHTLDLYYFYDGMLREFYSDTLDDEDPPYTEEMPFENALGDFQSAEMMFSDGAEVVLMGEENVLIPTELPVELEHTVWVLKLFLH